MPSIFDVANWFLCKQPMSHKKLQKMCYYAQAWSWALFDKPVALDARFEAWVHGPVCPVLYEKYKGSGWSDLAPDSDCNFQFTEAENDLLESVQITYGDLSANEIEILSHREPPWTIARRGLPPGANSGEEISPAEMRAYYKSIYVGDD